MWTSLDPHCPCRGSSSAELGLNSVLLGGLEGDHRPESWTEGEGRIPHTKKMVSASQKLSGVETVV